MLYIAIPPTWLLAALTLAAILWLTTTAQKTTGQGVIVVYAVFAAVMASLSLSSAGLWFTADYSISRKACYTGFYGRYAALGVLLFILAAGAVLYARTPDQRPEGSRSFFDAAGLATLLAGIILLRSVLRCTV